MRGSSAAATSESRSGCRGSRARAAPRALPSPPARRTAGPLAGQPGESASPVRRPRRGRSVACTMRLTTPTPAVDGGRMPRMTTGPCRRAPGARADRRTDSGALSVTLDDVQAARELLRGVARVTPLEGSRPLSDRVGGPVYLKCENLQRAGSFKIRGAYTRIAAADRRGAGPRRGRGQRRQPRAGRRAGRLAAGHHRDRLHARGRAAAQGGGDPGLRRRGPLRRAHRRRGAGGARGVRRARPVRCSSTRSTTRTSSPGRARSGWRSSSSAPTCGRSSSAPAAAG